MASFKPWLLLPPQWAHDLGPKALPLLSRWGNKHQEYRPFSWHGQNFRHPLGLAGGVDKNARNFLDWERLGASFVEVGTVTPQPQDPNPPPLLQRDVKKRALWNKLGFPNEGAKTVARRLGQNKQHLKIPLWVNLGKNRTTSNEEALTDYSLLFEEFKGLADSFVINISSPNTTALRDLQSEEFLKSLLNHYQSLNQKSVPILLKLSPDIPEEDIVKLLKTGEDLGVSGWILTNTTRSRPGNLNFPIQDGGVSGKPLKSLSLKQLQIATKVLGQRESGRKTLLVSVGGVMNADDLTERLSYGADLVQVYSALVFEGPYFFSKTLSRLNSSPARP